MSIQKKMRKSFRTLVALTIVACMINFALLKVVDLIHTETSENGLPQLAYTKDIERHLIEQKSFIENYLLGNNDALSNYHTLVDDTNKKLVDLESMFFRENSKVKLAELTASIANYNEVLLNVATLQQAGDAQGAFNLLQTQHVQLLDIQQQSNDFAQQIEDAFTQATNLASFIALIAGIISILIILLSIWIGRYLLKRTNKEILTPILQLDDALNNIAQGHLHIEPLHFQTNDEIERLGQSYNKMLSSLTALVGAMQTTSKTLNESAHTLFTATDSSSSAIQQVAHDTATVAIAAEQIAQTASESSFAMEETAQAVQRIANSTHEVFLVTTDATLLATNGVVTIQQAEQQVQHLFETTRTTNDVITKLTAQSTEIEEMSNVISSITDQTNLLALNASIEAARAGDHGKGFAVVAEEVRKLAEQSKVAAEQIGMLTTHIRQDTIAANNAMHKSLATVERSVEELHEAGTSFATLQTSIATIHTQIEEVSAASEQLSASAEEVAASITDISQHIQQSSTTLSVTNRTIQQQANDIEQIHTTTETIRQHAVELEQQLQTFS